MWAIIETQQAGTGSVIISESIRIDVPRRNRDDSYRILQILYLLPHAKYVTDFVNDRLLGSHRQNANAKVNESAMYENVFILIHGFSSDRPTAGSNHWTRYPTRQDCSGRGVHLP